jgi:hypothetical protein
MIGRLYLDAVILERELGNAGRLIKPPDGTCDFTLLIELSVSVDG